MFEKSLFITYMSDKRKIRELQAGLRHDITGIGNIRIAQSGQGGKIAV
jgi:hypothetical protein